MNRHLNHIYILIWGIFFILLASIPAFAKSDVTDEKALHGVEKAKAIFDVKVNKPQKFLFYLEVIGKAYDGIINQGAHPEFVIAVRGPSIRFISNETWSFSEEDQKYLKTASEVIDTLEKKGIRFEACSVAAGLFKVDHQTYLAEIHPVSNTFISLIGYQAQGYGLVAIN